MAFPNVHRRAVTEQRFSGHYHSSIHRQEFLEANGEEVLNGDDAHELWLILQQLDHPIYQDFLERQIAFGQLRFPDRTLLVDPYGSACFKTIGEALDFAVKDAKFRYVRWLLGSEKMEARTQVKHRKNFAETFGNQGKIVGYGQITLHCHLRPSSPSWFNQKCTSTI